MSIPIGTVMSRLPELEGQFVSHLLDNLVLRTTYRKVSLIAALREKGLWSAQMKA